jgi:hypothetical protein
MNFWKSLFGDTSAPKTAPNIPFGRYTDANKSPVQLAAWDEAVDLFEKGQAMKSYREFLRYLRDDTLDNVRWTESSGRIDFELSQGSRLVSGSATPELVQVSSKLAQAADLNVGFLRRLMEHNYVLKFSRYALSADNELCILFDSSTTDGSPLKLLHALRELSIHADKQDDLLFEEFRTLQPADAPSATDIPEAEKDVKYRYLVRTFEKTLELLHTGKPAPTQYPGGYAFHMLGTAYRIDYLVKPEGYVMDLLEHMHTIYFTKGERNTHQKVEQLRREIRKILERPRDQVMRELYRTTSTFGVNPPVNHERIANLIEVELPNMDWHLQQGNEALALGVPLYIAGYAFFHFSPPPPDRQFLHLIFRVTEPGFFQELGFSDVYTDASGKPVKQTILQAIHNIAAEYQTQYPKLKPNIKHLDFSSTALWAKSYLEMIRGLQLS